TNVIVHWPLAFVFAPALVQLPVGRFGRVAPFAGVSVTSTCSPAAGPNPPPLSFSSVTVKVCGWPISFVAPGAMKIRAATQTLLAFPELPPAPFVVRVSVRPATEVVTLALTTVVPGLAEVIVMVQLPVVPTVVHGLVLVNEPGPLTFVKLIAVPAGAL